MKQHNIDIIQSALNYVSSSDRIIWYKIGAAIKDELGDAGFGIWDDWSKKDSSYSKSDTERTWRSLHVGKILIGTLFYHARTNGWDEKTHHQLINSTTLTKIKKQRDVQVNKNRAEQLKAQIETAKQAVNIWTSSHPIKNHDYLQRKGLPETKKLRMIHVNEFKKITGYTPRSGRNQKDLEGMLCVVPLSRSGQPATLELIDGCGNKSSLRGTGTRLGSFWSTHHIAPETPQTLILCEGMATAYSVALCGTNVIGIACGSSSMYASVVKTLQDLRGHTHSIIIGADINKKTRKEDDVCQSVCREFNLQFILPQLSESDLNNGYTDFNDAYIKYGAEKTGEHIMENISKILNHPRNLVNLSSNGLS